MKKYLTLLLLATAFYSALSQSNHVQVDSLIQHLNDSMADTNRMKIYEQIATKMWTKDTVLSLQYVDSMLLLAKATNDVAAMGRSYLVRGTVYSNFNQYNKAIVLFKEALIFFEQVDDPQYLGTTYNRMGNNFYYQGMISNALAVYIKAQPFFELAGTKKRAAQNLNNIAIMYRSQEQYQKAIEIYEMSLKIKREVEDSIGIANTYFNIGLAYGFMKKGDFAIANLEKAKQIYKSLNAEKDIASIDLALGIQLIKQQSYEEGIFIIEQSLSRNRALFSSGDILNS
ncbi:MAG: tetratricopeptide repeat protein, partial [Bacteroidota bacterium]